MRRAPGLFVVALLLVASAPAAGDAPSAGCAGELALADLPVDIAPEECDLAGRSLSAAGIDVAVPAPGNGVLISALSASGQELELQVSTRADGLVQVTAEPALYEAAAVPSNDTFAQAKVVTLPWRLTGQSTVQSTAGEAKDTQANALCNGPFNPPAKTLWYRYTAEATRDILVRATDVQSYGSYGAVVIDAFRKNSAGDLVRAKCDPPTFEVHKGLTYYFRVATIDGTADFTFNGRAVTASDRPANDRFGDARVMSLGSASHSATPLDLATVQSGEPIPGCGPAVEGTVWYRVANKAHRRVYVHSGAAIALYRGTSLGNLRRLTCDASNSSQKGSLLYLPATGPHYVQVWSRPTATQATTSFRSGEPCPGCPAPCVSEHFALYDDFRPRAPFRWRFNDDRVPSSIGRANALAAVKQAVGIVTGSRNDCGLSDQVGAQSEYLGATGRPASACSTSSGQRDGVNVVEFGPTPTDFLAIACSEYTSVNGVSRIVESDVRISPKVAWTLRPDSASCLNRYDLVGTLAHEIGHVFTLGHPTAAGAGNQTMAPSGDSCNGALRTLGRGDVLGLRRRY